MIIEEDGLVGGRRIGMCTWWIQKTALQESDEDGIVRRYDNRPSSLGQCLSAASTTTLVFSRRANRRQAKAFGLAVRTPLLEVHYQLENADSGPIAYAITTWQADRIGLQLVSHPTRATAAA